jgi:uncharacterized damage-inducible protein DinB
MLSLEALRELYDYNCWARDRQLEVCSRLSEEQYTRPMGSSFASLGDTLVHLVGVEWLWLERWLGRSPRSLPWTEELRTQEAIRERWQRVEAGMRAYMAGLAPESLARPVSYANLRGEVWTYPLWQMLVHLLNHQSYHRGQVTTLLRQLGAIPAAVDFLIYIDTL